MARLLRSAWDAVPFLVLLAALLFWGSSYTHDVIVEAHCRGPAYLYLSSCWGQIELARFDDPDNSWQGVRKQVRRIEPSSSGPLGTGRPCFEALFSANLDYQMAGAVFPHWLLCLVVALWPAAKIFGWCRGRLRPAYAHGSDHPSHAPARLRHVRFSSWPERTRYRSRVAGPVR